MAMPRVTVITPVMGVGELIERTLCSVLDQGYPDLEYVVVDSDTPDGSESLLHLYEPELAGRVASTGTSQADRLNQALARATGAVVIVLAGGDLLLPGAIEAAADYLADADTAWLAPSYLRIDATDRLRTSVPSHPPRSLLEHLTRQSGQMSLMIPALFCRHDTLDQLGGFDSSLTYAHLYEYETRLLAANLRPTSVGMHLFARRGSQAPTDPDRILDECLEYITVAERYAGCLSLGDRHELRANCDLRRRIHALARAECDASDAKRWLLTQIVRRPWWLADEHVRHILTHGVDHPLPPAAAA